MSEGLTTFAALCEGADTNAIEIPLIQRDYAQGRPGVAVGRIRQRFLTALHDAVSGDRPICLDFVYGDVTDGRLHPLDGQQRLTTLFLLHWYLASRAGRLDARHGWKHFSYATRPSARRFCERLVVQQLPTGAEPKQWLRDQPWYQFSWRHDPTVQAMLEMLNAIHYQFLHDDPTAAWERLTDPAEAPITFHLLPITELGLTDEVYLKMNSRGRPLTSFENFKAWFEGRLARSCTAATVKDFSHKADTSWADMLWAYKDADHQIDEQFLNLFAFISEVIAWEGGHATARLDTIGALEELADTLYGPTNPAAESNTRRLIAALDAWSDIDVAAWFGDHFAAKGPPLIDADHQRVVLDSEAIDLFARCCNEYRQVQGRARRFALGETLQLYAVLLHLLEPVPDLSRRLRHLRNLVNASSNELRLGDMPALVRDAQAVVRRGELAAVSSLNQGQADEEKLKAELLTQSPAHAPSVFALEDHDLLRGCLAAFELEPAKLEHRTRAFHQLFHTKEHLPEITGALLTLGNYARRPFGRFLFGSSSQRGQWRGLLTDPPRKDLKLLRSALAGLLDSLDPKLETHGQLRAIQAEWLSERLAARLFDWRTYMVRYPAMRAGRSGRYVAEGGEMGTRLVMLHKERLSSNYRDAALYAIYLECGSPDGVEDPVFTGYETTARFLRLLRSGAGIRNVQAGYEIDPPREAGHQEALHRVCAQLGVDDSLRLSIPQSAADIDTEDRVQRGAQLLNALLAAGL